MEFKFKHWLFFYCLIAIIAIFLYLDYTKINSKYFQINYLDIGQGDSILIITPENQKILIDTGLIGNLNKKFKKYISFFDKEIDLFMLTHPDSDHIGDVLNILKNYQIKQIVLPKSIQQNAEFKILLNNIKSEKIPFLFANSETDLKIGKNVFIDFLYPFKNTSTKEQNIFNNSSLVFKVVYKENSFLFSGDAEAKQEKMILQSIQNLKADIYQAGHHGSKTSSSEIFLQAIQPKITIISAEKDNSFGHPHKDVIKSLKNKGSIIYQTAEEGDITFYSDGNIYWKK